MRRNTNDNKNNSNFQKKNMPILTGRGFENTTELPTNRTRIPDSGSRCVRFRKSVRFR
jgi:hypothetical protein